LDEDVDVLIAELIRSQNFQAISTDEVGRKGKSDPQQLDYAVNRQSAIVTHNRVDFEELAQQYFHKIKLITELSLPSNVRRMKFPNDCFGF